MTKRKALGSGLEALLSSRPTDDSKSKRKNNADSSTPQIISIPIHEITRNKNQPRQVFFNDALESMASLLRRWGKKCQFLYAKKEKLRVNSRREKMESHAIYSETKYRCHCNGCY